MIQWLRVPIGSHKEARLFVTSWPTDDQLDHLIAVLEIAKNAAKGAPEVAAQAGATGRTP